MLPKIIGSTISVSGSQLRFSSGHSPGSRRQTTGNKITAAMTQRANDNAIGGTPSMTARVTTGGLE